MKKTIIILIGAFFLFSIFYCSSNRQLMPGTEIQLTGQKRPDWIYEPTSKDSKDKKAFVGVSHDFEMEGDARSDALKDARQQIIDFMGVLGKRVIKEAIVTSGISSDIINPAVDKKEQSELLSESFIKTRAKNYHIEKWQRVQDDGSVKTFYKCYVLVMFDEKDSQDYLKDAFARARKKAESEKQRQLIEKAEELLNQKSLFEQN